MPAWCWTNLQPSSAASVARQLSINALRSVMAQETEEVWLTLLKIDHADMAEPAYLVDNTENITSNGNVHLAFPFKATWPSDESTREPVASLTVSNVDQSLIANVRSIESPPAIEMSAIIASEPDTLQYGPVLMEAKSVSYDQQAITFQLGFDALSGEPLGWVKLSPEFFSGMYV